MHNISGIILSIAILIAMQLLVVTATERTRGLLPWRFVLSLMALAWWIAPLAKKAYVDDFFYPDDSVYHEQTAREIAYLLLNQDWHTAFDYWGLCNDGYRFALGVFYAITDAPEVTVYSIHGMLAFWGLLSLLEMVCWQTDARRVPLWAVLFTCANPSALFWTTFNLKEGAMLWGICMTLRAAMRFGESSRSESIGWPFLGLLTAGFLRPHIIVAYLAAMAVGVAVRQRRIGLAVVISAVMVGTLFTLKSVAPAVFEGIMTDGVGTTLTERFHELNAGAGAVITYSRGGPTPFVSGYVLLHLRPFPWEVTDITTVAAGAEIWAIFGTTVVGWYFLRHRLRLLTSSYVITLLVSVVLLSFYFTYMYNMGLMVRQRVMAFPALISLAVLPALAIANSQVRSSVTRLPKSIPSLRGVGTGRPRPHLGRGAPRKAERSTTFRI